MKQFKPWCLEIDHRKRRRYFASTLGESYYNPKLAEVVRDLKHDIVGEGNGLYVRRNERLHARKDGAFAHRKVSNTRHRWQ